MLSYAPHGFDMRLQELGGIIINGQSSAWYLLLLRDNQQPHELKLRAR